MRRLALVLGAIAGSQAGHALAYYLAYPDPTERAAALAGHGYLEGLVFLLVAAGVAGLWWLARPARRWATRGLVLFGLQVGFFLVQEAVEATVGRDGWAAALNRPSLWLGLPTQAFVVWAALLLLRLVGRLAAARPWQTGRLFLLSAAFEWEPLGGSRPSLPTLATGFHRRAPPRLLR